jgi:hypothetical protein
MNGYRGFILFFLLGAAILAAAVLSSRYKSPLQEKKTARRQLQGSQVIDLLDRVTSLFPLGYIKNAIRGNLTLCFSTDVQIRALTSMACLALILASLVLLILMKDIGQLWYVKALLTGMCIILPYYVLALFFELYRYRLNRQVPRMIDEFRSAFVRHGKVKPALKECSLYIDKSLGKFLSKTADSPFIEEGLETLRNRLNNIWINMFVILLINYKENGGELIDQLYKLNKTMTRYGTIDKKKNRRLIWYEMFAVSAAVLSIPSILWMNSILLGRDAVVLIDAQANMIIGRVIGFSLLSLLVIRILRRV